MNNKTKKKLKGLSDKAKIQLLIDDNEIMEGMLEEILRRADKIDFNNNIIRQILDPDLHKDIEDIPF